MIGQLEIDALAHKLTLHNERLDREGSPLIAWDLDWQQAMITVGTGATKLAIWESSQGILARYESAGKNRPAKNLGTDVATAMGTVLDLIEELDYMNA